MLNHLAHYVSSVLHILIILWFSGTFFKTRDFRLWRLPLVYIFIPALFPIVNSIGNMWLNLVSSIVLIAAVLIIAFKESPGKLLFLSVAIAAINMLCELITLLVATIMFGENSMELMQTHIYNVGFTIVTLLSFFTIAWLVRAFRGKCHRKHVSVFLASNFRVFLLLATTIILGYFILYSVQFQQGFILSYIGLAVFALLIIVDVMMLFGTERDIRRYKLQADFETMQLQEDLNEQIIRQQQVKLNQMYSLAHDFKNHLSILDGMLGDNAGAERYMGELQGELDNSMLNQFIGIRNKALQAILCKVATECDDLKTIFKTNISYSDFSFMEYRDICSFFANALDNAVHACGSDAVENRVITLDVHNHNAIVMIEISNTYATPPRQTKKGFLSQKDPSSFRLGIGTKNMERAIARYHGTISFSADGGLFIVTANLPLAK